MGRTREPGCGFQSHKNTQHLKNPSALTKTECNLCLDQSDLPWKHHIPVHMHSHGQQDRSSGTEAEGAPEPSSGHGAAGPGPLPVAFKLALPLSGDIQDCQLVSGASLGSLGAFHFNPWLDQEQSAGMELPAVIKPCQGAFPCPFPPHSCFLSPIKPCTPARGAALLPVPRPGG